MRVKFMENRRMNHSIAGKHGKVTGTLNQNVATESQR